MLCSPTLGPATSPEELTAAGLYDPESDATTGRLEPVVAADASGFAVASPDQVLSADPDVIMLADVECCAVGADVVASRPGWSDLTAVSNGAVVELQDYMVRRWGPRVVDLVEVVAGGTASAG